MNNKPYREGTSKNLIIQDGWSRGFDIGQTINELKIMGYDCSKNEVQNKWNELSNQMFEDLKKGVADENNSN